MFKWSGCVKKWLILVFLGVASFICICPGCRIKSKGCSGSLSLSPGWAYCGGDNCNVFLWPRKASNYHCKGPHRKGCGRSHFVSRAPLSSCCGTINTLVPFHCPHHQLDFSIRQTFLSLCSCCSQICLICCLH